MTTPRYGESMEQLLTNAEMARWIQWKQATSTVMDAVTSEIAQATGLSSADFAVLTRVVEEGGGSLRQQRLSDDLGWERSRLSRHLARMELRGLVNRGGTTTERIVSVTGDGRDIVKNARVAHAAAVRRNLLAAIPDEAVDQFWALIALLSSDEAEP